jgi:3-hydroxyacyl-CoA dehydrogenase
MKYSPIPVVAAPHGMALGGGCEVCLGADRICAAAETYMGLVEVGVGLIPGGGGTKEMLLRNMEGFRADVELDTFGFVRKAFETIGMAKVSFSAKMGQELAYLKTTDRWVLNRDRLIHEAKKMALGMAVGGYTPPPYRDDIKLPGETGYNTIRMVLYSMKMGNYISDHDELIGTKLAYVLCGGETSPRFTVDEQYILDLEREAFLSLCGEEKTIARMQHMLQTGKPLRN